MSDTAANTETATTDAPTQTTPPILEKAKVEKLAKNKERTIEASVNIENKSALRAVARLQAANELYPNLSFEDKAKGLVEAFYQGAKWQHSWRGEMAKVGEDGVQLAEYLSASLGTPAPRPKRIRPDMVTVDPPATEDPEALLQQDTGS